MEIRRNTAAKQATNHAAKKCAKKPEPAPVRDPKLAYDCLPMPPGPGIKVQRADGTLGKYTHITPSMHPGVRLLALLLDDKGPGFTAKHAHQALLDDARFKKNGVELKVIGRGRTEKLVIKFDACERTVAELKAQTCVVLKGWAGLDKIDYRVAR